MFEINKIRHPLPKERRTPYFLQIMNRAPMKYPFDRMNVGDSFDVPFGTKNESGREVNLPSLRSYSNSVGRQIGRSFVVREILKEQVFRCWRKA